MLEGTLVKVVVLVRQRVGLLEPLRRPGPEGAGACARLTTSTSRASASSSGSTSTSRWTRTRNITDDARIRAALPTLKELREKGARLLLRGAPRAAEGPRREVLAAARPPTRLAELLGEPVALAPSLDDVPDGDVVMLENVRFEPGETKNDPELAQALRGARRRLRQRRLRRRAPRARLDGGRRAPAAERRRAAARARGARRCSGILDDPQRPLVAVVGGAKVTDKIGVLDAFLERADRDPDRRRDVLPVLRGRRATTVGDSLCEEEGIEPARRVLAAGGDKLRLPVDLVAGREFAADTERAALDGVDVPDGWMGLDVGPRTAERLRRGDRATPAPCSGTARWARSSSSRSRRARASSPRRSRTSTRSRRSSAAATRAAALAQFGLADRVDHLSTGGGASLELIEGKALPGVEALTMSRDPVHRRQLEDEQDRRRGGGVHRRRCCRGSPPSTASTSSICPPFTGAAGAGRLGARLARRRLRAEHARGRRAAPSPARSRAPMLTEIDVDGVDPRPLRAARSTSTRPTARCSAKVAAALDAGPRRRSSASARPRTSASAGDTERKLRHQVQEGAREGRRRAAGRGRHRLRADLGDRHRPGRDARAGAGGDRVRARARRATSTRARPSRCASSTAARSSPTTPPSCWRCPTSTARWSAARQPRRRVASRRSSRPRGAA